MDLFDSQHLKRNTSSGGQTSALVFFALLVGFSFVQPNATDQRAYHPRNDNGEANPPSIHLFSLKGQGRKFSDLMALHTKEMQGSFRQSKGVEVKSS